MKFRRRVARVLYEKDMSFYYDSLKGMDSLGDLEINGMIIIVIKYIQIRLVTIIYAVASKLQQNIKENMVQSIIYNKPTRCNSGGIVFIKNYKYALHVSDALCVHLQEQYKL